MGLNSTASWNSTKWSKTGDAKAQRQSVEPFRLGINLLAQNNTVSTHALLDSGADFNVISWEMWNALGQPKLSHTELGFIGFHKQRLHVWDALSSVVYPWRTHVYTLFYVANKSEILESVILSRTSG